MRQRINVQVSTVSSAQPDEIFALLVNSATYPLWFMIRYYESLRGGREGLRSVGARRLFETNSTTFMREEVTEIAVDERVGYTLFSGFPLLEYKSQTRLEKVPSAMTWLLKRLVSNLAEIADWRRDLVSTGLIRG